VALSFVFQIQPPLEDNVFVVPGLSSPILQ